MSGKFFQSRPSSHVFPSLQRPHPIDYFLSLLCLWFHGAYIFIITWPCLFHFKTNYTSLPILKIPPTCGLYLLHNQVSWRSCLHFITSHVLSCTSESGFCSPSPWKLLFPRTRILAQFHGHFFQSLCYFASRRNLWLCPLSLNTFFFWLPWK